MNEKTVQDLTQTERVLFQTMKAVQRDRMEHQKAQQFADGPKRDDHKRKQAACMNKENVLEKILTEAGLIDLYRSWAWGK